MAPALYKIIVGLDYGTTYTGVSYVISNADSLEKIEVINQWPGTFDTASKAPTRIAYASDNRDLNSNKWGYTVSATHDSYSWTKLLLDKHTTLSGFDDPSLKDLMGCGMMRVPADKSPKEVCKDFLFELYRHTVKELAKEYSQEIFNITPIECWITVPAIWSDAAKEATKSAAMTAGFGSRCSDTVNIITEPEAAALAALKPQLNPQGINSIKPGENVLVCDCGGGTVDITTYQIVKAYPRLDFKEICVGTGGKLGSTYIDRNFNQWLTKTFGKVYTDISPKKRGPGSALMRSFETAKRTFSSEYDDESEDSFVEIEHLYMKSPSSSRYDEDDGTLRLTYREMKSLFEPVIQGIIGLVHEQAEHARSLGQDIHRVILVGGFGSSVYLNNQMSSWCVKRRPKPKLLCPPQCQSAVVRGAALRGLERLKPSSRIARRHYGCSIGLLFRRNIDPEHLAFTDKWDNHKYCRDRISWEISKGQAIDEHTEAKFTVTFTASSSSLLERTSQVEIYCCSADEAPEYCPSSKLTVLGSVSTVFSTADFSRAPKRRNGCLWVRRLEYTIKVKFSADDGSLIFTTQIDDKEAGHTKVEFHKTERPLGQASSVFRDSQQAAASMLLLLSHHDDYSTVVAKSFAPRDLLLSSCLRHRPDQTLQRFDN